MKKLFRVVALTSLMTVTCGAAKATEFPEKGRLMTMVVSFPPGGVADMIGRTLAQEFTNIWGVNAVVENRPGGDFMIGAAAIANARKDGYTMGVNTIGFALNGIVRPGQRYNPIRDFAPVGFIANSPLVVAVKADSPYQSFAQLQAAAEKTSGKLTYSSCCTAMQFAAEMLKSTARLPATQIRYKGSAPAVLAAMSGETDFTVDTPGAIAPFVRSGKLRALAVTARSRFPLLPGTPHLDELGVPGTFEIGTWYSLVYPAGTPSDVIAKANHALKQVLEKPEVRQRFSEYGVEPRYSTPETLAEIELSDYKRYEKLAKDNGLVFTH